MFKNPSDATKQITSLRAKTMFPLSSKSAAKIESFGGLPAVCELILDGLTLAQAAERIGVARSELSAWHLNLDDPMFAAAMRASAERCLERAEMALDLPGEPSMAMVQLARERASIWRHRASVRDARYSPKGLTLDLTTAGPVVPPQFTLNIMPANWRQGDTFEGEPPDVDLHDPDRPSLI